MNEKKNSLAAFFGIDRSTKAGTYTVASALVVLALLIVVNLIVGALPSSLTRIDISPNKINTISATTKKFISDLDEDVMIYMICENGTSNETLETFLGRYSELSGHIKVEMVDPVKDPTFLEAYSGVSSLSNYSLILQTEKRYTFVDYSGLEYYYIEGMGSVPAETYESLVSSSSFEQYYSYYYQYYGIDLTAATHYFGGEQSLTSAIEYVTVDTIPHLYVLTGEGESDLSDTMQELLEQVTLEYETLNLSSGTEIPEDASTLLINAPANDLSSAVTEKIRTWLAAGGNLLLLTSPKNTEMANLMSLVADYGATPKAGGMLYEGNANRYSGVAYNLILSVNYDHDITYNVYRNGYSMIMSNAHGITVAETLPENVTSTVLFATSSAAYTRDDEGNNVSAGETYTGVALENSETGSQVVWFGSADAFTESAAASGMGASYYLTMAISWESENFTSSMAAIEATEITSTTLTASDMQAIIWLVVLVVAVPAVTVVAAIIVWYRRKKR